MFMNINEKDLLNKSTEREAIVDANLILNLRNIFQKHIQLLTEKQATELSTQVFYITKEHLINRIKTVGIPKGNKQYFFDMNTQLTFSINEMIKRNFKNLTSLQVTALNKDLRNAIKESILIELQYVFTS